MAKITAPLLSLTATGTIKKTLVYSSTPHFSYIKNKDTTRKRKDVPTIARLAQRENYLSGVLTWNALTPEQKLVYNVMKYPPAQTGFNRFMSRYLKSGIASSNFPYLLPINF
jgi:hypothetical protein